MKKANLCKTNEGDEGITDRQFVHHLRDLLIIAKSCTDKADLSRERRLNKSILGRNAPKNNFLNFFEKSIDICRKKLYNADAEVMIIR